MPKPAPSVCIPALTGFLSGRAAYRASDGREVGTERFEFARHTGGYTVRALTEMNDIGLLRDVSFSLNPDWTPRDATCRVIVEGRTLGTTWFQVDPHEVRMEGMLAGSGRVSQRLPTEAPCRYLGLHPVVGDALIVAARGEDDPEAFVTVRSVTNSISFNGDQGLLATPTDIDVAFIGYEEIEVTAGRFSARRYALRWTPDWPPANLWVRREDCVFLKMTWDMIDTWHELAELHERA